MAVLPLAFAFFAGIAAFFSPCAAVLLPGYVTHYISKYNPHSPLLHGLFLGTLGMIGFSIVFSGAAMFIFLFGNWIKHFIPWLNILLGIIILGVGFAMLFGYKITVPLGQPTICKNNKWIEAFSFGIVYGITALGCVFPLFLSIIVQGFAQPLYDQFLLVAAYLTGLSILFLPTILTAHLFNKAISKNLATIIPHISRMSSFLLLFSGGYIIYYQGLGLGW